MVNRVNYLQAASNVLFFQEAGERLLFHGLGRWDDVIAIAGERARPVGLYPERYVIAPALAAELAERLELTLPNGERLEAPVDVRDLFPLAPGVAGA
jgi:hypothetical protein